jgi:uncharacterized membrane protein YhaH (DUF805 family)
MKHYINVLKKYAVFSGRAARKEYWMFALWNVIISVLLGIVVGIIDAVINSQALVAISYLYALAVLVPCIAVSVRRLHDINRSGWWFLIVLVPVIGAIVLLVFSVMDSQPGDNRYGSNPKGISGPRAGTAAPTIN